MLTTVDPAELIIAVRRRGGLTQAELARRAGTSQPVVSAYERGRRDPTYTTLRRLVESGGQQLQLSADAHRSDIRPADGPREHAARLVDVLSLADAVPVRSRSRVMAAPRLVSH